MESPWTAQACANGSSSSYRGDKLERWTAILIALTTLLLAAPGVAEEKLDLDALREERDEKIERYFVRSLTQTRLSAAVELLEANKHEAARKKLAKMKFSRLNPYERVLTYRLLAYSAIGAGDSAGAIGYFQKAVDEAALPIDEEASVRFSIIQLEASLEEWENVETGLNGWFPFVERPNGVAYYLLAISRYRRDLYKEALPPALKALEIARKPNESWLQLAAALHLQAEDFDSAVPVLEDLVTLYPKKQYWVQLSLIYGARGDYERALQVQQLAYTQGLLTGDDELRRLARSFLLHQLPDPAAQVLESGIEQGRIETDRQLLELLGNAWIAAREYEKALEPLQRAAEMSEDGKLYLRLGQVRVQREDWKEATALIQKAIEKGGLHDTGKAHLLLGISYYSDDHPQSAQTAFRRARKHESARIEATAWLEHIERQSRNGRQPGAG